MADDPAVYSIDTSALIHGWREAYPIENFPTLWQRLEALIAEGKLVMCDEAFDEIKRKDDGLYEWCKDLKENLVVEVDDGQQEKIAHIMGLYPKLVDTAKGKSGADPFVIALAMSHEPKLTVVTEEKGGSAKKPKIPYVCNEEGIQAINLLQLIQRQGWVIG